MKIDIGYKETIKRNSTYLLLKSLLYIFISCIIFILILYYILSNSIAITTAWTILFISTPLIITIVVALCILLFDLGIIIHYNNSIVKTVTIKGLKDSSLNVSIEWTTNSNLKYNRINAYLVFENYKIQLLPSFAEGNPDSFQSTYAILKPILSVLPNDNDRIIAFKKHYITIPFSEWQGLNENKIINYLRELTETLKTGGIRPE